MYGKDVRPRPDPTRGRRETEDWSANQLASRDDPPHLHAFAMLTLPLPHAHIDPYYI